MSSPVPYDGFKSAFSLGDDDMRQLGLATTNFDDDVLSAILQRFINRAAVLGSLSIDKLIPAITAACLEEAKKAPPPQRDAKRQKLEDRRKPLVPEPVVSELRFIDQCRPASGSFVSVDRLDVVTGVPADATSRLYFRECFGHIWDLIMRCSLSLVGVPGASKSTLAWLCSCVMAQAEKSVAFVELKGRVQRLALLRGRTMKLYATFGGVKNLLNYIVDCDVLVVDGADTNSHLKWREVGLGWKDSKPKSRRFIIVSSFQSKMHRDECDSAGMQDVQMPSWRLVEYQHACADEAVWERVKLNILEPPLPIVTPAITPEEVKEDCLEQKFFFAGGNVRWFMAWTVDEAKQCIREHFAFVSDRNLVTLGLQGERSIAAVNHLMQVDAAHNCMFVSEYVTRLLSRSCDLALVEAAEKAAKAFSGKQCEGWIFEMRFSRELHNHSKLKNHFQWTYRYDGSDEEVKLQVNSVQNFDRVEDIGEPETGCWDGAWFEPNNKSFGGIDGLFVLKLKPGFRVVVYNVCLGNTNHKVKQDLSYRVVQHLQNLGLMIKETEYTHVVQAKNLETFKLGTKSGNWNDIVSPRFRVATFRYDSV